MGFLDSVFGGAPEQQYYSKGVRDNLKWLTGQFRGDDTKAQGYLDAFAASSKKKQAELDALGKQAGTDLNNLYQTSVGYDPLSTYERLRTGNLGALNDFSGNLTDKGRRDESLAAAAMGLGGRPDGSYERALRADRVSKNIAPYFGSIMSNLGADTNTVSQNRYQNLANSIGLIDARTQAPLVGYGMELDPLTALSDWRNTQTGLLGNQAGVAKANTSGYMSKPGALDYVNKLADTAKNVYGAMSGMGIVGNMMGGMGGGGGGSSSQPLYSFTQPSGGGGGDSSSVLALLANAIAGQRNTSSPYWSSPATTQVYGAPITARSFWGN